jgi:anti-sigma B factor antagonist
VDIETKTINGVSTLALNGRFDAFETSAVTEWFDRNIKDGKAQVIIDLAGVNFLDSAALAALVKGMKRCREHGGDLYLCGLQQPVRIIFELTRLDKAFKIFPDTESASGAV